MGKTWNIVGIRTVSDVVQTVTIATVHELEYHAEWMGDEYVTVTVKSPTPIDFHFGDYLVYRSEYFRIDYDPNVIKKAKTFAETDPQTGERVITGGSYGEGFTYDNIKLYSDASKMKSIDFKDVVLNPESAANTQVYTSLSAFSFYAASVEDLADRLQANLDREGTGWRVLTSSQERCSQRGIDYSDWGNYFTVDGVQGETDVNVEVTNDDHCWQVLKFAYEKFGLSYYCTGKTIVIGGDPVKADHIFRYGKDNGLYEVERTSDENQEIVTKLFAYGSEQNLPLNYYANKDKKAYTSGMVIQYTADNVTKYAVNTRTSYEEATPTLADPNKAVIVTSADGTVSCVGTATKWTEESVDYMRIELLKSSESIVIGGVETNGNAENFYAALGDSQYHNIYFTYGIDKNVWPQSWIETSGDYPAMLSINKLMLPGFPDKSLDQWVLDKIASSTSSEEEEQWETIYDKYTFSTDKHDPWIASANISAIGIKEGIANYDGSSQKEIYPTINNTSSATICSATHITDNGYLPENSDIPLFHLYMYRGDGYLDWSSALNSALDTVYVEMTSGYCTGRKFKVNLVSDTTLDGTDVWDLTCEREKDSSLERYFPYYESDVSGYCQVRQGDTFVVTGIQMPDEYIEAAAEKLFIAACGYLDRRDHMRYTYLPKVDEIYMQRQDDYIKSGASDKPLIYGTKSYHDTFHAGMQMEFEDTDLGIWHTPYIDQLTIKENGNNGIPTYEVVLRDEKEKGTLEKLAETIADLQHPVIAPTERQTRQSRNAEYPEWVQGQAYYYQTLNPVPFNGVVYIETSYVWHRGCLWMCMRTLTTQEPWFTASDWKCVRSNNISLGFYTNTNPPMPISGLSVRPASIDETVVPYLLIGQEDISSIVTNWAWVRDSGNPDLDAVWSGNHTGLAQRTLHLTTADFPSGWDVNGGKVCFTCTATFPFNDDNAQISNQITVT